MIYINYQKITKYDTANGPGIRTTIWLSGCNHYCNGCHNPETWNPESGKLFTDDTLDTVLESLENPHIRGVTFSGGDPLHPNNRDDVNTLVQVLKFLYREKDIWVWTGYLYEDVKDLEIMNYIDVLVDGPFILEERDITAPYTGSPNQRVIDVKKSKETGDIVVWSSDN